MKRCPECRRDYYDDSLLYCLDDGAELLEGPGSFPGLRDEPQTAILHETEPPAKAATQAQIHTTNMPRFVDRSPVSGRSWVRTIVVALVFAALLSVGSFLALRYLRSDAKQIGSIAVMPFTNESGNADLEYLSDGMTDTIIANLSQLQGLTVKARSAVFRYKGSVVDARAVGQDLNAQAILNGRVTGRGDQLTVNVELIDAQTENVLWAAQYDRKLADLLTVQSELTRDVVGKLSNKLSGAETQKITKTYTTDPEAYRLLLQGRYFLDRSTREDTERSLTYLQQALDQDGNCALCWAEMGRAYAIQAGRAWVTPADGFARSRDATNKALSIDPSLAEGYAQLGRIQGTYDLDLQSASASYRRALELAPSNAAVQDGASVLAYKMGRFDEAIALSRQALVGDPLSPVFSHNLGLACLAAGQLAEAEKALRKAVELAPQRLVSNALLAIVLTDEGRLDEGVAQAEKEPDEVWRLWAIAIICHRNGQQKRSDDAVQKLVSAHSDGNAFQIAEVYAVRGETDRAFQWLETAYQKRDSGVTHTYADPQLSSLHADPRWAVYIKKLGFNS